MNKINSVLSAIRDIHETTGSWPTTRQIASAVDLTEQQVRNALPRLRDRGHIRSEIVGRDGMANLYGWRILEVKAEPKGVALPREQRIRRPRKWWVGGRVASVFQMGAM